MNRLFCFFLLLGLTATSGVANAEDLKTIWTRVDELVAKGNYAKALTELQWAKTEIEKKNTEKLKTFLPDDLAGYKGGKVEASSALGMSNIERTYTQGGNSVKVSLTGGGAPGGMGGLAQLGQMAAMFGGQGNGMETVRIAGRTATLNTSSGNPDLSVFLTSGTILKVDAQSGKTDGETLKKIAEGLKLDELDGYLMGGK